MTRPLRHPGRRRTVPRAPYGAHSGRSANASCSASAAASAPSCWPVPSRAVCDRQPSWTTLSIARRPGPTKKLALHSQPSPFLSAACGWCCGRTSCQLPPAGHPPIGAPAETAPGTITAASAPAATASINRRFIEPPVDHVAAGRCALDDWSPQPTSVGRCVNTMFVVSSGL